MGSVLSRRLTDLGGNFFGGKGLGFDSLLSTTLVAVRNVDSESFLGFELHAPFGDDNEKIGFGACHTFNKATDRAELTKMYRLTVKFPRGGVSMTCQDIGPRRSLLPEPVQARDSKKGGIGNVEQPTQVRPFGEGG